MRNEVCVGLIVGLVIGSQFLGASSLSQEDSDKSVLIQKTRLDRISSRPQPSIFSINPKSIRLERGGPSAIVLLEGQYFETVISAQVIKEGRPIDGVSAHLVQPWPQSKKIELQAWSHAEVATGYQLRMGVKIGTGQSHIDIPSAVFILNVGLNQRTALESRQVQVVKDARQPTLAGRSITLPDLIVEKIRIDPPNPKNDTNGFLVYATIKNQGNARAFLPRGWGLFHVSASNRVHTPNQNDNFTLESGVSVELLATGFRYAQNPIPAGTCTVTVKVDPSKQITEISEDNNEMSVELTIEDVNPPAPAPIELPDLIINDLWLDSEVATISGDFKIVASIKNQGASPAILPNGYPILRESGIRIVDEQIWDVTLQPGESREFRCAPQRLQVGTSIWTFYVDPLNRLAESDETNNSKTIEITIVRQ